MMMYNEKKQAVYAELFALLRCVLHGGEAAEVTDFRSLIAEARKQTVDGMLYGLPAVRVRPEEEMERLQWIGQVGRLKATGERMNRDVAGMARTFDRHGIHYAVMKGQTCAAYYPEPLYRRSGDIDVYVVADHFDRAAQLLETLGFVLVDRTMLHSTFERGGLTIELHFALQKLQHIPYYRRLQRITREAFDQNETPSKMTIGGYAVTVLPPELNVLLLTVHAFNHVVSGGLGLRQVVDWQVVLAATAATLRWETLMGWLEETGMRRMFEVMAYLNVTRLGMDESLFSAHGVDIRSERVRRVGEKLLCWIETCGNFGKEMDLGEGRVRFVRYYGLFLFNLVRFFRLCPLEMLAWPWMKGYRALTGKNHL